MEPPFSGSSIFLSIRLRRLFGRRGLRFGGDGQEGATLKRQVAAFEREVILHTIEREGSLRRAARALGVDHSTLVKKRRQYEMEEAHPDNR